MASERCHGIRLADGSLSSIVVVGGPGRRSVLVVDDEPSVRATVREALAYEGYDVTEAGNGAEALAAIREARPDVIVFDLWMPVMDGWAFRQAQLHEHPGIPVVVLSAVDLSSPRLRDLRPDEIVGKPFELDALYAALARALGRS